MRYWVVGVSKSNQSGRAATKLIATLGAVSVLMRLRSAGVIYSNVAGDPVAIHLLDAPPIDTLRKAGKQEEGE